VYHCTVWHFFAAFILTKTNLNVCRIRPDEQLINLKRRKLQEIELNWESFTDYILHTAFSRKLAEPTDSGQLPDLGTSKLVSRSPHRKRSILDGTLYDGSNDEALQCVFVPNPFPYNLIDGHHWTLWYNCSSQPHCDGMITEDVRKQILAEVGPTAPFDFAWQVQLSYFNLSCPSSLRVSAKIAILSV
jgi:hypothetical protein